MPINPVTPTSQNAFDATTNRLVGTNNYDPRGNLTAYGSYTLSYDGDDKVISASGITPSTKYEYDGEGHRVRAHSCSETTTCVPGASANTTIFVYDAFGRLAAEYHQEALTAGTSYFTQDHLGSTRLETDASGQQVKCSDYLPFGEEIPAGYGNRSSCFNANDNRIKFTSKERDAETGLDYFLARYYSGAQGRFLSPDEFKGGPDDALSGRDITPPGPLPYADIGNPQSLNKYAYAYNNPLRYTDPDGHLVLLANTTNRDRQSSAARLLRNLTPQERAAFRVGVNARTHQTELQLIPYAKIGGQHSSAFNRLITMVTDLNHTSTVKLQSTAANPQTGQTESVARDFGGGITIAGPKLGPGNSLILLAPEGNLANPKHPGTLPGQNGGLVEDRTNTVAAHEVLGHGFELMTTGSSTEGTTIKWENEMRQEQGLPPRQ
jgi:RHS repeat-associated protein